MSTTILTNIASQKPVSLDWPRINPRVVWVFSFLIIASLLIFYIFQVNETTRGGFLISDYEKKMAELSQQNKNLEIYFSQTNSLTNLETLLLNANYEKVSKVHYIQILDSSVAYERLAD